MSGRTYSTVFLGIDHNFSNIGPPLLFETMIFGPGLEDAYQTRCSTWEEAERQHRAGKQWAETLARIVGQEVFARFAIEATSEGVKTEDGGQAKILTIVAEDENSALFVRLHSWSETDPPQHPEFDRLVGKRVIITVRVEEV